MIEITYQSVVDGLSAIVAEHGEETIYTPVGEYCTYIRNGQPDCIVGHYLTSVGVPLGRLVRADDDCGIYGTSIGGLLSELETEGLVSVESEARTSLRVAQAAQDIGDTWGEALNKAIGV